MGSLTYTDDYEDGTKDDFEDENIFTFTPYETFNRGQHDYSGYGIEEESKNEILSLDDV